MNQPLSKSICKSIILLHCALIIVPNNIMLIFSKFISFKHQERIQSKQVMANPFAFAGYHVPRH